MLLVGEIMQVGPVCVSATDSVVAVAQRMRDNGLDTLPVCDDGDFLGMVGQLDVVHGCVAAGLDPATTPVGDLIGPDPSAVQADAPAEEALLALLHSGRRCLAVLQGARLVGLVSQADLVEALPDRTVNGILAVVSRG